MDLSIITHNSVHYTTYINMKWKVKRNIQLVYTIQLWSNISPENSIYGNLPYSGKFSPEKNFAKSSSPVWLEIFAKFIFAHARQLGEIKIIPGLFNPLDTCAVTIVRKQG